mmetsp:Transcript_43437/g.101444  ORF Transcript_43437/g.101444 Transcript_43437/m.101444 type:complete len:322 (-) Transcript_43437:370-1335(-)
MKRAVPAILLLARSVLGDAVLGCVDRNTFCPIWAGYGECQKNPRYMLLYCKLTCGDCTPAEILTTSATESSTSLAETSRPSTTSSTIEMSTSTLEATTTEQLPVASSSTDEQTTSSSFEMFTSTTETTTEQLPTQTSTDPETTSELALQPEPKPQPQPWPQPQCGSYRKEAEADLAGKLLSQLPAASADVCCSACDETAGCAGFAFFASNCYLKAELTGTFGKPGCTSHIRRVSGTCAGFDVPVEGRDLSGTLITSLFAADRAVCCSACRAHQGCEGFSYFESYCYLKTNVYGTYPKAGCSVQVPSSRRLTGQLDEGALLV